MTRTIASLTCLVFLLFALDVSATSVRRFTAARKSSHLRRRGLDFEPHHGKHTLLFEDESSVESAARVHLEPKHPTLVLDDVCDHIKDVVCTTTSMTIHFHAPEAMNEAAKSWNNGTEFVFVSSHTTCAEAGSHEPYLVSFASVDTESFTIAFVAEKQTFKQATHRISVDLGRHVVNDIHRELKRRQVTNTTSTTLQTTISNVQTLSLPPTVSFRFPTPTGIPVGSKNTQDIKFSAKNRTILPPDPAIIALFPGAAPLASVNLACQECSMSGSVTLEVAGFSVNSTQLDRIIDFFDGGYFQFTTNKLAARMALQVGLLPGFVLKEFVANLTRIPLNPIEIPRVLKLGPAIELTIPMGITLNSAVNFTTGFELAVPDNSKIVLNVSSIGNSSQTGFDKTSFKILPFSANLDNLNFNLTAGLRPKLVVSAGVGNTNLGIDVEGGVGAFMNFPKLVANVAAVKDVNSTCDGPAAKGATNRAVRIIPSATFDMGLHWDMGFTFGAISEVRGGEQTLVSKTIPLPNQCLVFDSKTQSLVPATNATTTANGTSTSTTGSNGGGSGAGAFVRVDSFTWSGIVLLLTAAMFTAM